MSSKAIVAFNGITSAITSLGKHGETIGSVKQQVHDGDTLVVQTKGNFGVRFLGMDAAEVSLPLPDQTSSQVPSGGEMPHSPSEKPEEQGGITKVTSTSSEGFAGGERGVSSRKGSLRSGSDSNFISINDPRWRTFMQDPFTGNPALEPELLAYLQGKLRADAAESHHRHALAAQTALETMITDDMQALGRTKETFQFFITFAYEVTDGYGRLLGFINRYQAEGDRPLTYNERLLAQGLVHAYFIWPNINPFRKAPSVVKAVIKPGKAAEVAEKEPSLRRVRQALKQARQDKIGLFNADDPLAFESFELRFLSRRSGPSRWVIDLTKSDDVLLPPQQYYKVPHAEDRLFIPEEFVPLFIESGWKRG